MKDNPESLEAWPFLSIEVAARVHVASQSICALFRTNHKLKKQAWNGFAVLIKNIGGLPREKAR